MKNLDLHSPFQLQSSEVCAQLGVSRDTLYAYVSRGLIRKEADPLDARKSLYHVEDLQRLLERQNRSRARKDVAASTIDWGEPVLQSSITAIHDQQLFYRGTSAVELSRTKSFEEVFELLAGIKFAANKPETSTVMGHIMLPDEPIERMTLLLANEAVHLGSKGGGQTARKLLAVAALAAAGVGKRDNDEPSSALLARNWCPDEVNGQQVLNAALVLCADHELNASTYASRVAASARANLASCLLAGIATLSGDAHGGATNLARQWERAASELLEDKVALERFVKQNRPPGFGHPFYPDGDPRANELLRIADIDERWDELISLVHRIHGVWPTLDFGLAIIEDTLGLPAGAGLGIFALGRIAGWTAHIFEQRKSGRLIRPRARYAGQMPRM